MERWSEFYQGNRKEVSVSIQGCPEKFSGIAKIYHSKKNETGIILRIPVHNQQSAEWFLDEFDKVEFDNQGELK